MSMYIEKAKELGELILKSEQSKLLSEASATFKSNEEAVAKMDEFNKYRENVRISMQNPNVSKEEIDILTKKITEMTIELKQDEVIGALVFAENEFNGFVNQIMGVLKDTITGNPKKEQCSSGDCSGCSC